jgi:sucrose phosphorylase
MIRLDAIPYLWKQLGTSCAHLPQTHDLISLIRDVFDAVASNALLLTETNVPHRENVRYFGDRGDEAQMIYNFSLAPLILWSLYKGDARVLTTWARGIEWISERATYLNITATHDGIGMRPTEGILSESERAELVQLARDHGGDITGKRNADGTLAPYELNLNYYDAVSDPRADEPEELQIKRFLVSQAIPMAMMGMPGIYIHSLLGSRNDTAGVKASGRARSINREQLRLEQLRNELADPGSRRARVFSEMKRMLEIRARQSAFHPDAAQEIPDLGPDLFAVVRHNPVTGRRIAALHNVTGKTVRAAVARAGVDLLGNEPIAKGAVDLAPYQIRWIESVVL